MIREEYYGSIQTFKENHLKHHGVLGQKWGIRRYQNPDGSLTAAGKAKLVKEEGREAKKESKFQSQKEKAIEKGDANWAYKHQAKLTDDDFNRISSVINRQVKYNDLVNKASRIRTDRIRNATDKIAPIQNLLNNTMGSINNALSIADRLMGKGGKDSGESESSIFNMTKKDDGSYSSELISATKKYTENGIKKTKTYKYK